MNQQQQIIMKSMDVILESVLAIGAINRATKDTNQAIFKSTPASYTYAYTHSIDLGQGRVRNIHYTFALNHDSQQLELVSQTYSDSDG